MSENEKEELFRELGLDLEEDLEENLDSEENLEQALYDNFSSEETIEEETIEEEHGFKRKRNNRRLKKYNKKKEKNYTVKKGRVAKGVIVSALAVVIVLGTYVNLKTDKLYQDAIGANHTKIVSENYVEGTSVFEDLLGKINLYDSEKHVNLDDKIKPILKQYENVFEINDYYNNSGNPDKLINNEYCYLEFYEVYNLIGTGLDNSDISNDHRLIIMDTVLRDSVEMAYDSYSDGKYDYTDAFYEDLNKYGCFLEFVRDRVSSMTGMDMSKYNGAISEYLTLGREKPYNFLSESTKEQIDELLKMYERETRKLRTSYNSDVYTFSDIFPMFKGGGRK